MNIISKHEEMGLHWVDRDYGYQIIAKRSHTSIHLRLVDIYDGEEAEVTFDSKRARDFALTILRLAVHADDRKEMIKREIAEREAKAK